MRGTLAALALLSFTGGCGQSPAGLVLVFPDSQSEMDATHATVLVIQPGSADKCPQYLAFQEPDGSSTLELTRDVDLKNGVASGSLKGFPTGNQTVLVKVENGAGTLFLHGCRTGNIESGSSFQVNLQTLMPNPDLQMTNSDGPVDDLQNPPDMTMHKILSINLVEMRDSSRKLSGATVTVVDSTGASPAPATSDANGNVKIDTLGLTPPFSISAATDSASGFHGAATLSGANPSFTSDTVTITVPIELDAPAPSPGAFFSVQPANAGHQFNVYWQPTGGVVSDMKSMLYVGPSPSPSVGPLIAGQSYRVAVVDVTTQQVATPQAVTSPGQTFNPVAADFKATTALTLTTTASVNAAYTAQKYAVLLTLPALPNSAPIPIVSPTPLPPGGTIPVPAMANLVQGAAVVTIEMTGTGGAAHAELRQNLANAPASTAAFSTPVPDPPTVTVTPALPAAASTFVISATPPGSFPLSSAFVHVVITDGAVYHWHLIAPAASPTNITVPAGLLAAGTYTMTVSFVKDFSLADVTVQATMTDDYTKLTRPLAEQLSQSIQSLTVN